MLVPKSLKKLDDELRAMCKAHFTEAVDSLSHITAVGVPVLDEQIGEMDYERIKQMIFSLVSVGINISPDFKIDFVEIKQGRDFRTDTNSTDIVLICYLEDPQWVEKTYDDATASKKAWGKRLTQSGAKIVVNHDGGLGIDVASKKDFVYVNEREGNLGTIYNLQYAFLRTAIKELATDMPVQSNPLSQKIHQAAFKA